MFRVTTLDGHAGSATRRLAVPTGGRALRRMHHLLRRRLLSIARPRFARRWEHGGRTRNLTSRHAQRTRLTFAPRIAGGCQRRAPTTWRRGGTAAQQGRQGGYAARHLHFRPAQRSGCGQGACFTPRCRAATNPLTPHSPSMLTSLMRFALSQSTTITIATVSELDRAGAGVFGAIFIDTVLFSRSLLPAVSSCRRRRQRCSGRACAGSDILLHSGARARQPAAREDDNKIE